MIHLQHIHTKSKADIEETSLETGNIVMSGEMLQCVHCQHNWIVCRGSGRHRGWCMKCGGPTCGSKACETCIPLDIALGYDT